MMAEQTEKAENPRPESWNSRTLSLLGHESVKRLEEARVLVVGTGGVGGYAVEMLARSGVGNLTLMDADTVSESNLNRQVIALRSDLGKPKTLLFRERIKEINPDCRVKCLSGFLTPDGVETLLDREGPFDVVIDAIDTVAPKVALIACCLRRNMRILSSMGAGGRTDVSKVELIDLWSTREDGLARAVRQRLKKMGLRRPLKTVASTESPKPDALLETVSENKRSSYGTIATVPAVFGIYLAAETIRLLTEAPRVKK